MTTIKATLKTELELNEAKVDRTWWIIAAKNV